MISQNKNAEKPKGIMFAQVAGSNHSRKKKHHERDYSGGLDTYRDYWNFNMGKNFHAAFVWN